MNHKLNHKSETKIRIRRQHHKILRIKVVFKSEAGFPWISELWRWICHECLHVRKKTRKTTQIFPFSFIVTYRGRAQEFRPQWLFVKVYYVFSAFGLNLIFLLLMWSIFLQPKVSTACSSKTKDKSFVCFDIHHNAWSRQWFPWTYSTALSAA